MAASSSTTRIVAWPVPPVASVGAVSEAAAWVSAIWRRERGDQSLPIDPISASAGASKAAPAEALAHGKNTRNSAPPAAGLSTSIQPSWSLTMPWLTASPRPVP